MTKENFSLQRPDSQQVPHWNAIDKQKRLVSSQDVLYGVSAVLEHFIARSDREIVSGERSGTVRTDFDGPVGLDTSVHGFLEHLLQSGLCSKECFIMSLVYAERILQRHPDFVISRSNVHRFVLISVLVGSKIIDDFYCRNVYYAMAGGIPKAEMNELELRLCFLLDFDLNVEADVFAQYRDALVRSPKCKEIKQYVPMTPPVTPEPRSPVHITDCRPVVSLHPNMTSASQMSQMMVSYPIPMLTPGVHPPVMYPQSSSTGWMNPASHANNNHVFCQDQETLNQTYSQSYNSDNDPNIGMNTAGYRQDFASSKTSFGWFGLPPNYDGATTYLTYVQPYGYSYHRNGPWLLPPV
eukprot:m.14689 g.14689  ORF g.14689 m.14689 type:complete len:353 (+) comp5188_c0_seq1:2043-3101(+)